MVMDVNTIAPFFLIVVGLTMIYFFSKNIQESKESGTWPSIKGRITRSIIHSEEVSFGDRDDSTNNYTPDIDIEYEYEVNGESYTSQRIKIGGVSSSTQSTRIKGANISVSNVGGLREKYPTGREVDVYYNPNNPKKAVLETGGSQLVLGIVGLATFILGIFVYFI